MRSTYWEKMDKEARSAVFWRDVIIEIIATTLLLTAQCILPLSWGHEIYHGSLVQVCLQEKLEILLRIFLQIDKAKNRLLRQAFLNIPGVICPLLRLILLAALKSFKLNDYLKTNILQSNTCNFLFMFSRLLWGWDVWWLLWLRHLARSVELTWIQLFHYPWWLREKYHSWEVSTMTYFELLIEFKCNYDPF